MENEKGKHTFVQVTFVPAPDYEEYDSEEDEDACLMDIGIHT